MKPTIKVTRKGTCRLCTSQELELVVPLAPTPVAEKYVSKEELHIPQPTYPLDLYLCRNCGHVQLLDVVDPEFLFDNYTYMSSNTKLLVEHFDETAEQTISRFHITPNSLVADIGSNDGSLLRCFQKRGMRVIGVDPAKEIARKATEAGIPTIPEFFKLALAEKVKSEHGPASVVCAFNVFAHADDLAGMAESIRALLGPNGIFVFEASYLLDIIERVLLGTIFHEHLSHHSIKPIAVFLRRHGLELIDVQRNMIQGGSVVGTVQLIGGPHTVAPSVRAILDLEAQVGLDQPETFKAFAGKLQRLKTELGGMMIDLKRQGKSLWGYGAARSGTTLIAQMGLGSVISYIVDDSGDKQNKYNPGDHIPILPSKALCEQKPDYVFILAWIHAQRIIENNRVYLEQGGHFIVCFPEIQIISAATLAKK